MASDSPIISESSRSKSLGSSPETSEVLGALVEDLVATMNSRVSHMSKSIMAQMDGMGKQVDELELRINALVEHQQQHQQASPMQKPESPHTPPSPSSTQKTSSSLSPRQSTPLTPSTSSPFTPSTRSPRRFFSKSRPCEV